CPHSLMQWTSSMTSRPTRLNNLGRMVDPNSGLLRVSGVTKARSITSDSIRSNSNGHVSWVWELKSATDRSKDSAMDFWLRMRARSGETITVGPPPLARIIFVEMKYTADFPHPVAWTTSALARSWTTARVA